VEAVTMVVGNAHLAGCVAETCMIVLEDIPRALGTFKFPRLLLLLLLELVSSAHLAGCVAETGMMTLEYIPRALGTL
jgi:hypothetical protein